MFLGKRDQSGKITKQDVFANLFRVFYQLAARDRLEHVFAALKETEGFKEYEALIPEIGSAQDFQSFLETIPSGAEIVERAKQEIRNEYAGLNDQIAAIEAERKAALEDPDLDYSNYGNDLLANIERRLRIELEHPSFDSREQFEDYRAKLEEIVSGVVQQKLESSVVNGVRVGDMLKTTQMIGDNFDFDPYAEQFDEEFDDNENEYFYGCDDRDVPLETVGELVDVLSDDRFVVRFEVEDEEMEIHLHPDEFESTGDNVYRILLDDYERDVNKAAQVVINGAESLLLTDYQEKARDGINSIFDAKRFEAVHGLRRKFGLDKDQMNAIANGEDFDYKVDGIDGTLEVDVPFDKLVLLLSKAMSYKLKKNVEQPGQGIVRDESDVRSYIQRVVRDAEVGNESEFVTQLGHEVAALISKQYYLKERELRINNQTRRDTTNVVLESLLADNNESRTWLRRLFLYSTSDIFIGGDPFAPPSEELVRVLKLETGNGCSYARCTFCTEYAGAHYFVRKPDEFRKHAEQVRELLGEDLGHIERVFLAGGNLFDLPTKKLLKYLAVVEELFNGQTVNHYRRHKTYIRRVEAFTRTEGILRKSVRDLRKLYDHNLGLLYWGVETGSDELLEYVNKGITRAKMEKAAKKIRKSGIMVSLMIMPGLGGIKFYEQHVTATREMVNLIKPRYTTFHTVTPKPQSVYFQRMVEEVKAGTNRPLTDEEVVEQMYDIVSGLDDGYRSLVATYYPPSAKIAVNPISFRGYLHFYGGKNGILNTMNSYFGNGRGPSQFVPVGEFNKGSVLRERVRVGGIH